MALTRLCPFCLEAQAECICPDEDNGPYQVNPGAGPQDTASGLTVLHAPAEGAGQEQEAAPPYRGVIAIEWPPPFGASPYSAMTGHLVKITDALTGKPIRTCLRLAVTADMEAIVTADLTMFTGEDGEPLLEGEPVPDSEGFRTGTFPFVVSEMKVRHA